MAASKPNRLWIPVVVFLVVVIITGGIIIWSRYQPGQPIEISLPEPQGWSGMASVSGAVIKPGLYPFKQSDSIQDLIRIAGGLTGSANLSGLEFYVPAANLEQGTQKVDINRAEPWLLEALPGIGPTLAQRIIDYRQQYGAFNNTDELLKVPGIGDSTYQKFKNLITVADR